MEDLAKLKVLLPHFIEHGEEHIKTYKSWADKLSQSGKKEDADRFYKAASLCAEAMSELKKLNV